MPPNHPDLTRGVKPWTHADLVVKGARWLARARDCGVVATEVSLSFGEIADVIGWHGNRSCVIECKTTRPDFNADTKKTFRAVTETGMGVTRYYLAPARLLFVDELPEKWGLLEIYPSGIIRCRRASGMFDASRATEISVLLSILRRLPAEIQGVSIRHYTIETKATATIGIGIPLEINT